jgi:uncharacterized protein YyaL (SSP411 family)
MLTNPVNWFPWGDEALIKQKKKTNLFLSVLAIQLVIGACNGKRKF